MSLKEELRRKFLHLMLLFVPLLYLEIGKWKSLIIFAILTAFILSLDLYRQKSQKVNNFFVKIFGAVLRQHELDGAKLCGASFVGIAACINFLIFKKEIAVTSFIILVISDAAAAIVGKSFPSRPFFEKTISGASAFFATGFAVLVICGYLFHCHFLFYLFGIFALTCVTIIESRPSLLKLDDNLTIPLAFSFIMTLFDLMWNYQY